MHLKPISRDLRRLVSQISNEFISTKFLPYRFFKNSFSDIYTRVVVHADQRVVHDRHADEIPENVLIARNVPIVKNAPNVVVQGAVIEKVATKGIDLLQSSATKTQNEIKKNYRTHFIRALFCSKFRSWICIDFWF